ncbi:hypothetical protein PF006_g9699 [Phytophthora fragariae]|uniref:Uncharacterized protein n=1 Tax=Phytophthora fragariae TaxID=53985 RepID=A0A6A3U2Q3_9STRA|nr:hypothetical protein PF006_g9699 [Phytophthora fragariae]
MIADLREFTETTDLNSENGIDSIRIQARLLRIAPETVRNRRFFRLHMGEHHSPEPLEEQQKVRRAICSRTWASNVLTCSRHSLQSIKTVSAP